MRFTRRLPRPSAAMLVASAALFAALGGTSYAALKITGDNVANGTLTGVDLANKSIGPKKLKPDSIGGTRVKESTLGTVPSAEHATSADSALDADNAVKAADSDKLDGLDSGAFMKHMNRLYEANVSSIPNFGDGAILGTLDAVPAGSYLVSAKFGYDNDGAAQEIEHCTLHVPGADDTLQIFPEQMETVVLQEAVTSSSDFSATVTCTGDGDDDMIGNLSIIAVRVD
jgi:hypothetical protein